jgi:hypothetical protein
MEEIVFLLNLLVMLFFGYRLINVDYKDEKAGYIIDGLIFSFNVAAVASYLF